MGPDIAAAAARLAQFAGAAVLFGAPLFGLYGPPSLGDVRTRRLLGISVVLVILGAAASLGLQTAAMTGAAADAFKPASLWLVLSSTQFGAGLRTRLGLGLILAATLALAPSGRRLQLVCAGLGAALLATFAWTGHGAADEGVGGWVHLGADIAHLLSAGAWLGALIPLAQLAGPTPKQLAADELATLRQGLERFSGIGPAIVGLLVLSGLANSWFLVGPAHIAELPRTAYGLVLLAKLALFLAMLALAAANRYRLTPALARAQRPGAAADEAVQALRASLTFETALGAAVLAAVALLGTLPPPASF